MSVAMIGDWKDDEESFELDSYSKWIILNKWETISTIKLGSSTFELKKLKKDNVYIVGSFQPVNTKGIGIEERFVPICYISLGRNKSLEMVLKKISPAYTRIVNVNGIYIVPEFRGLELATTLYKWLVNEQNFTVMGDSQQFFGARKLWAKLSKFNDVRVDLINVKTETIIQKDVLLYHGETEEQFDTRLWSMFPDASKKDIRPILRKIV
jgi:hypothetical protein